MRSAGSFDLKAVLKRVFSSFRKLQKLSVLFLSCNSAVRLKSFPLRHFSKPFHMHALTGPISRRSMPLLLLLIFKGYPGRTQVLIEGVSIIWCVVHGWARGLELDERQINKYLVWMWGEGVENKFRWVEEGCLSWCNICTVPNGLLGYAGTRLRIWCVAN